MARFTITQKDIETRIEKALENACAFFSVGKYKLALTYKGEADGWLSFLEDEGVWFDDVTVNDHVQNMIDALNEDFHKIQIECI